MSWIFDLPTPCPFSSADLDDESKQRTSYQFYTVLFLTSDVTNSQRSKLLSQLCDPEPADSWTQRPKGVYARPVKSAKWIRNWTPGKNSAPSVEKCIARMLRASLSVTSLTRIADAARIVPGGEPFNKRLGYGMILIDEDAVRGLDDENGAQVIVITWMYTRESEGKDITRDFSAEPEHEDIQLFAARVPIRRANLLLSFAYDSTSDRTFEAIAPDAVKLNVCDLANAKLDESQSSDDFHYVLPSHLPQDLELKESEIDIVSLVYISDEEIDEVVNRIHWPADELEEAETPHRKAHKRQTVNPKEGATTARDQQCKSATNSTSLPVTIYNWRIEGEPCTRAELYHIFQAIQPSTRPDGKKNTAVFIDIPDPTAEPRGQSELLFVQQGYAHPMTPAAESARNHLEMVKWPKKESVKDLWPYLFRSPPQSENKEEPSKKPWFDATLIGDFEVVPNPETTLFDEHVSVCYILLDLTETDLRKMKAKIQQDQEEEFGPLEFIHIGSSLASADIQCLMAWFEECLLEGRTMPHQFLALDQQSFDYYVHGKGDKDEAMIIGSSEAMHNRHGKARVHDFFGFGYGRLDTCDAISGCVNLSVANMSFVEEIVPKEKITYLYWSDILESEKLVAGADGFISDEDYQEEHKTFSAEPK